nr:MAG TPA: hypothetical protein [Caudoviricetes sp.]
MTTPNQIQPSDLFICTICLVLTSLTVSRPWLFQPYDSYYSQLLSNLFRLFSILLWAGYPLFELQQFNLLCRPYVYGICDFFILSCSLITPSKSFTT